MMEGRNYVRADDYRTHKDQAHHGALSECVRIAVILMLGGITCLYFQFFP